MSLSQRQIANGRCRISRLSCVRVCNPFPFLLFLSSIFQKCKHGTLVQQRGAAPFKLFTFAAVSWIDYLSVRSEFHAPQIQKHCLVVTAVNIM